MHGSQHAASYDFCSWMVPLGTAGVQLIALWVVGVIAVFAARVAAPQVRQATDAALRGITDKSFVIRPDFGNTSDEY